MNLTDHPVQPVATVTTPWGDVHQIDGPGTYQWVWEDRAARADYVSAWRDYVIGETGATVRPGFRVRWSLADVDPDSGERV